MTDLIRTFSDAELDRMIDRAWREAARCWLEARSFGNEDEAGYAMYEHARNAEQHWRHLWLERRRRRPEYFDSGFDPSDHVRLFNDADRREVVSR